jgi:hypothetical protein
VGTALPAVDPGAPSALFTAGLASFLQVGWVH